MKPPKKWRRLDNAAKIFPPNSTGRDPKVFRFTCELTEQVDPEALRRAAGRTLKEFPFFRYTLRHGVFWYYLEDTDLPAAVEEEREAPCQPLYLGATSPLFRILYYRNRISLEVYHVLTDGAGALQFLRTLVCRYLQAAHPETLADAELPLGFDASAFQRMGDSFDKYYTGEHGRRMHDPRAYRIRGEKLRGFALRATIGETSVAGLLEQARARGTTITALLGACLLVSVGQEMALRDRKKPVVATIPVNLRNYFPSDTARNFFSVFNIGLDFRSTPCELEPAIAALTAVMHERLTRDYLQNRLNALAGLERNPFLRVLPLALKDPVMRIAGSLADAASTVSISNVGKVTMPDALSPYIRKFDVFITTGGLQICSCSYGDTLSIGFTSAYQSSDIEQRFFRMLTALGLQVTVSSNGQPSGEETEE